MNRLSQYHVVMNRLSRAASIRGRPLLHSGSGIVASLCGAYSRAATKRGASSFSIALKTATLVLRCD